MAPQLWHAPPAPAGAVAAPVLPPGSPPAAYLDGFRLLANAVVAGASPDDLGLLAARAFHALLGPSATVLVLGKCGNEAEILGSVGDRVGLLAGRIPLPLLPEVAAALQAREPVAVRPTGLRHPFGYGGRAVVARIPAGTVSTGALAAYLVPGDPMPDENLVRRSAVELTALLGAALQQEARRQPWAAAAAGGPGSALAVGNRPRPDARTVSGIGTALAPPAAGVWPHTPAAGSPDLLRSVLDALPYAVTVVGTDGRPLLRNAAAVTAARPDGSGPPPAPGVASPRRLPAIAGDRADAGPRSAGRGLGGGQVHDARFHYRNPVTDEEQWVATTAVPVRSADGALLGTVSLARDITVQMVAEEERDWLFHQIQTQRELLDRLIESAPVSILLLDPGLRVRLANRRFLETLSPQERGRGVLGRTISEIMPAPFSEWHAATVAAVLLRGASLLQPEVRSGPDDAEVWWEVAATPLRDGAGEITGVLFCSHDVTARVQAGREEARLLAQVSAERERIRVVLDLIPGGVIAVDPDVSHFLYVNQTALAMATRPGAAVGGPVLDADGRAFWDVLTPEGAAVASTDTPLYRALFERRTIAGEELQIRQAEGGLAPVVVSATPLPGGPDGTPGGTVVVFVDITPLKEVERLKDDFLAMASHDLRSPLTVISGRVQLLQRSYAEGRATPESAVRSLTAIHDNVQQLADLAATLLDVTLMGSGRFQVRRHTVDLAAVARRIAGQFVPASPFHALRLAAPPDGLEGQWEETRIAQVIQNLVQNAIKYSPGGGLVEVTVRADRTDGSACAVLTVRDQGIGIAVEERERIFDRFTRGEGARQRGLGGTGLGLHICRGIVRAHGGTISVDGAPDGGSIFTVVLPLDGPTAR